MKSYLGSAILVAGGVLGYITAIQALTAAGQEPATENAFWQRLTTAPKSGFNIYAIGHFRQEGFLPPARNTQIYRRTLDDAGDSLRANCNYQLLSKSPPARWWAISAKSLDQTEPTQALVASDTFINGQDELIISAARENQSGNWLPLPKGNLFSLTFALIEPTTPKTNQNFALPIVKKESCS